MSRLLLDGGGSWPRRVLCVFPGSHMQARCPVQYLRAALECPTG